MSQSSVLFNNIFFFPFPMLWGKCKCFISFAHGSWDICIFVKICDIQDYKICQARKTKFQLKPMDSLAWRQNVLAYCRKGTSKQSLLFERILHNLPCSLPLFAIIGFEFSSILLSSSSSSSAFCLCFDEQINLYNTNLSSNFCPPPPSQEKKRNFHFFPFGYYNQMMLAYHVQLEFYLFFKVQNEISKSLNI